MGYRTVGRRSQVVCRRGEIQKLNITLAMRVDYALCSLIRWIAVSVGSTRMESVNRLFKVSTPCKILYLYVQCGKWKIDGAHGGNCLYLFWANFIIFFLVK